MCAAWWGVLLFCVLVLSHVSQAASVLTARTARVPHATRSPISAPFGVTKRAPHPHTGTHATAAAPPVDTAPPDVSTGVQEVEPAKDQIDWRQQWCAEDRPWPVTVLGRELVVWRDGGGQWRVFDDACPHRKVALSEGRKEADGTLACAYHGWRFDGEGACTEIPQLEDTPASARTRAAPAACATAFPTAVRGGLLFVWMVPGADGLLQSAGVEVQMDEEVESRGGRIGSWYKREMPMSFMVAMENLTDPSHFSFAHHGVTPSTSRYDPDTPMYDMRKRDGKRGYQLGEATYRGSTFGPRRSVQDVRGFPGLHHLQTRQPWPAENEREPKEGVPEDGNLGYDDDKISFSLPFYVTPVTETTSRVIFRTEFYGKPPGGLRGFIFKNIPDWANHIFTQSVIFDGDMVFLNRQSMQLMHGELEPKEYFMPAPADMATRELYRHYNTYSVRGVDYYPHTVESGVLPPEQLLDRYEQHVKDCKVCRGALGGVRTVMRVAVAVATGALVATGVAVATGVLKGSVGGWQVWVGVGGAILAAIALKVRQVARALEKKFLFEPYVHQDKN